MPVIQPIIMPISNGGDFQLGDTVATTISYTDITPFRCTVDSSSVPGLEQSPQGYGIAGIYCAYASSSSSSKYSAIETADGDLLISWGLYDCTTVAANSAGSGGKWFKVTAPSITFTAAGTTGWVSKLTTNPGTYEVYGIVGRRPSTTVNVFYRASTPNGCIHKGVLTATSNSVTVTIENFVFTHYRTDSSLGTIAFLPVLIRPME